MSVLFAKPGRQVLLRRGPVNITPFGLEPLVKRILSFIYTYVNSSFVKTKLMNLKMTSKIWKLRIFENVHIDLFKLSEKSGWLRNDQVISVSQYNDFIINLLLPFAYYIKRFI